MMSDGLLLDAADALVARIQVKIDDLTFPGTVAYQDDPYFELEKAQKEPETWVVDMGMVRETGGQSITLAEFVLAVIVRRKIATGANQKSECRAAIKLTDDLDQFIRGMLLAIGENEAVCIKTDRSPARDHAAYHNDGLYLAEITTHWRMVTDDDEDE
jgi:hypothetical protein